MEPSKEGWVKIHRNILKSAWYQDSEAVLLFLHLNLKVSFSANISYLDGKPVELQPGQLISGRKALSVETGIGESKITRLLEKFEKEGLINRKPGMKGTVFTLSGWGESQILASENGKKIEQETEQQSNGKRTARKPEIEQETEPLEKPENATVVKVSGVECSTTERLSEQEVFSENKKTEQQSNSNPNTTQECTKKEEKEEKETIVSVGGKPPTLEKPISENSEKELRKKYENVEKTKKGIVRFLKMFSPLFPEPYVEIWNIFAEEKKLSKVKCLTDSRKKKLKTRLNEKSFHFIDLLKSAAESSFLMESNWFSFDWIIENEGNYIKVLEGNYRNKNLVSENEKQPSIQARLLEQERKMQRQKELKIRLGL